MEDFKDLKRYILEKNENLIKYIKEKREMLANVSSNAVSSLSGFVKNNSRKFVKAGLALGLAGTMFLTGCGVQVDDQTGEVTSFGIHVGYKDDTKSSDQSNPYGDGAIIEDVTPKQNNTSKNYNDGANIEDVTKQNITSNNNSNSFNDGAIIEDVTPSSENKKPVSSGNKVEIETKEDEEETYDGAIIVIVTPNSESKKPVSSENDVKIETKDDEEEINDGADIEVVTPSSENKKPVSSENDVEIEAKDDEEEINDGAIIEVVNQNKESSTATGIVIGSSSNKPSDWGEIGELEETEVYDDITVVEPNDSWQEENDYVAEDKEETEEIIDDGAIIEIVR